MKNLGKVILHIPARKGSKRVPNKNMRLMNNHPMIFYTIKAAIEANITKEMYINTDSEEIIEYVQKNFKEFKIYKRDSYLTSDKVQSDEFNYDIITKLNIDTLIMINPVCPLITKDDIKSAFSLYKSSNCDTLISSSSTQMQTFYENKALNINIDTPLAPSQENKAVTILNWAITIWDGKSFRERMLNKGYASLGKNRVFFDLDPFCAIKVSEEKDFLFAEKLLKVI